MGVGRAMDRLWIPMAMAKIVALWPRASGRGSRWESGGYDRARVRRDAAGQPEREGQLLLVHFGTQFIMHVITCRNYDDIENF